MQGTLSVAFWIIRNGRAPVSVTLCATNGVAGHQSAKLLPRLQKHAAEICTGRGREDVVAADTVCYAHAAVCRSGLLVADDFHRGKSRPRMLMTADAPRDGRTWLGCSAERGWNRAWAIRSEVGVGCRRPPKCQPVPVVELLGHHVQACQPVHVGVRALERVSARLARRGARSSSFEVSHIRSFAGSVDLRFAPKMGARALDE